MIILDLDERGRNTTIAVVGVFAILAAVGSAASRDSTIAGPTARRT